MITFCTFWISFCTFWFNFWDFNIFMRSCWVSIRNLLISSFSISCFCKLVIICCKVFIFLFSMCCLVKTSSKYSEKESILSHSTESSWSMKLSNEFSLGLILTIHTLREFSKTGRLLGTLGISIWHSGQLVGHWVNFIWVILLWRLTAAYLRQWQSQRFVLFVWRI